MRNAKRTTPNDGVRLFAPRNWSRERVLMR
jgi:hypothetical protein